MGNAAGEETRIAVAANDNTAQAVVCAEAARCSYYLIFNGDGTFVETIEILTVILTVALFFLNVVIRISLCVYSAHADTRQAKL